ncbi:hypothetical protein DFQ30_001586, partial [Apophysomyces sp. BC1015]
ATIVIAATSMATARRPRAATVDRMATHGAALARKPRPARAHRARVVRRVVGRADV